MVQQQRDELGQALVNWLWSFYFSLSGLAATLSKTANSAPVLTKVARTVMLSVGCAALIVCSRTVWREIRAMRKPPVNVP